MTFKEYEKSLRDFTGEQLQIFNTKFGGGQISIEQRVREFVDNPEHERRICQILGLQTEAEKLTDATLKSANAADQAADSAKLSMIWSGIACVAAIIAAIAAVVGLFLKK